MTGIVKTRFAPSPTGMLHIGGARTALVSYLMAKSSGGDFVVRIEDTDKDRSNTVFSDQILKDLSWLGLKYDSLSKQSENIDRHLKVAHDMISDGVAYIKDGAIFFSTGDEKATITDGVKGSVTFDASLIDDFVIVRSSGSPSFMLSNAVDDFDSGITDIVRGDDHFSNSAKQSMIYNYLGYSPNLYHIPLVLGSDKKKLSKRNGGVTVGDIVSQGILPEALNAYLLKLGIHLSSENIYDLNEAAEMFDSSRIRKSPSVFDITNLISVNSKFINQFGFIDALEKYYPYTFSSLVDSGMVQRFRDVELSVSPKIKSIHQAHNIVAMFIGEEFSTFHNAELFLKMKDFTPEGIKESLDNYCNSFDVKKGPFFKLLRESANPSATCPFSIYDIIYLRGRDFISDKK